jgi:parallel beta-helix repeat protein
MKRTTTTVALLLILSFLLVSLSQIDIAKAESTIFIDADGNVVPDTAPIHRIGSVYFLTGDIESIVVDRGNIILDGNGYRMTNTRSSSVIYIRNVNNVTVKNHIIKDCEVGIMVARSSNITVSNNTITGTSVIFPELQPTGGIYLWKVNSSVITKNQLTNNYCAISIGYESMYNTVIENNITNNNYGMGFWESSNNKIFHNNFINNTVVVFDRETTSINVWEDDQLSGGNYWNNYNGTDNDTDGIGDTPYVIDENNQDNYPLMNIIPEFPSWIIIPLLLVVTLVTIIYKKRLNNTSIP